MVSKPSSSSLVCTKTSPIVAAVLASNGGQLLHKGMNKFADDVDVINKNLEATRKKQEELDQEQAGTN